MRHNAVAMALGIALISTPSADKAWAGESDTDLAKQLSNPVADLISVPFQGNYNDGLGPLGDGDQYYVNFQPVIPITLNEDWNLISRTIVPIISQNDLFPGAGSQFGLGNTTQSFFLSPQKPWNGIIWGVGPVIYVPTATDDLLGPETWGLGPTGVALWQGGPWTVGILANQIWSVAGDEDAPDINATYMQPFLSYTTSDAWTFTLNSESTYNWETDQWSVPVNGVVSKLVRFGKLPVSLFAGARYWVDTPKDTGPEGWGARAGFTILLPKGG